MKKTPKVVREALLSGSVHTVGGIQLREVTLSTLLILEEINSPLVDEQAKTRKDPMKNMDLMRAIYVFSKHPREAFATFRLGQAAFDAAAIELGASISVPDTKAIGEKMAELIARATSTIVSAEKKNDDPFDNAPNSNGLGWALTLFYNLLDAHKGWKPDYVLFELPVCQAWMLDVCGTVANGDKIGAPLYEDAETSADLVAELDAIERRMKRKRKKPKRRKR